MRPTGQLFTSLALGLACLCVQPGVARSQESPTPPTWNPAPAETRPVQPGLEALKSGRRVGVGFHLGSRAGLSVKLWPRRAHGVVIDLGTTLFSNSLAVALGYQFHAPPIRASNGISVQVTVGLGARLRALFHHGEDEHGDPIQETDIVTGLRVPVGMVFLLWGFPVELFVEVAPAIDVWEAFGIDVEGLGGARIYF